MTVVSNFIIAQLTTTNMTVGRIFKDDFIFLLKNPMIEIVGF